MKFGFFFFSFIFSFAALANVSGNKIEALGVQAQHRSFAAWSRDPQALITPELTNLAVQACLRKSQEALDISAHTLTQGLTQKMAQAYRRELAQPQTRAYDIGLSSLARLVSALEAIDAANAAEYQRRCDATLAPLLGDETFRGEIVPLFRGRLAPGLSANLPAELRARLEKMAQKGLQLTPLTWTILRQQICTLEGYYSTSRRPELWKLFSVSRALANVLPAEKEENDFLQSVNRAPDVVTQLSQLNRYSSVAGKFNGPAIGMTEPQREAAGVRLTGAALGSKTPALLAFFTTAWRETLQKRVLDQDYPEKPFALISLQQILDAVGDTAREVHQRPFSSQTEWGMVAAWQSALRLGPEPGETLTTYRRSASLAWLALNAETNIRQNEKITGYSRTGYDPRDVTTTVYGTAPQYQILAQQLASAREAYAALPLAKASQPACLGQLDQMIGAAAHALGKDPAIAHVSQTDVSALRDLTFEPVIADIGMEINDEMGDKPEGIFRLHLATGEGHETELALAGGSYRLWTPSALVLHLNRAMATAEWRQTEVGKYDPTTR